MARILCTGNITLDIINTVEHYPAEDEEIRAVAHAIRSGGNAANTALVLAQLQQDVYLAGTIANDQSGHWLKDHLRAKGVNVDHLRSRPGSTPTSYITLNQANGSRTIVHYRDLGEPHADDFSHVSLERIDWFHFEGRNVDSLGTFLDMTEAKRVDQPISIELEKYRSGLEELANKGDVLLFSRAYAIETGHDSPQGFLNEKQRQFPEAIISLTWGEGGAWVSETGAAHTHIPATEQLNVIDTIGAGDCYNAGLIDALVSGQPLREAVQSACLLAERKIQQTGLELF